MAIEHTLTKNLTFTNLARKAKNGIVGAYMLGAATLGFGLGQSTTARADDGSIIDPHVYSTPVAEVVNLNAPLNAERQSINLTLYTTLPPPNEAYDDFGGKILQIAPVDNDGNYLTIDQIIANDNRLPALGVTIMDTDSSMEETRILVKNAGTQNDVSNFTVPYLLVSMPGTNGYIPVKTLAKNAFFFGNDGSTLLQMPLALPRRLIYPTSNETSFNETLRTQNIVDEANRIPSGYESNPRVVGSNTIDLEMISGTYSWSDFQNNLNVSGCLWFPEGVIGSPGYWNFGHMGFDRVSAGPNIIRAEIDAFRSLTISTRQDGPITDGENLAYRLGDAIVKHTNAQAGTPFMAVFYAPNSDDGSGKFPGSRPPYVVLSVPIEGEVTNGTLQMPGVVPTEQTSWGSAKAIFR